MRPLIPRFTQLGAKVAFIGVGKPWMAQGFDEEFGLGKAGAQVLTDPSLASFRAAGMKHGLWRTLGPQTWPAGLRALLAGHRQGKTQGDPWQQGGALVVSAEGATVFRHVDGSAGDHVRLDAVLRAVERLQRA